MPEINKTISFNVGIEQIVAFTDPNPAALPDAGQYVPGEGSYKQQLSDVLFPPSVEQALIESFGRPIENRELLTPPGYHAAQQQTAVEVEQAAQKQADRPEGGKLQALSELLKQGDDLNNLLNTYRHLLHQA